ncbi:MAG: DUF4301 family protein [Bacteroidales bacterium]
MFTDKDKTQIVGHELTEEQVIAQINSFKRGFDSVILDRPATIKDGIIRLSESEVESLGAIFDKIKVGKKLVKFVPASGAATRMFKLLFELVSELENSPEISDEELIAKNHKEALSLLYKLPEMACFQNLESKLNNDNLEYSTLIANRDYSKIITYILEEKGLAYKHKPKGLIEFHSYSEGNRKAFEEQLVEASMLFSGDKSSAIHFTVSPEHLDEFESCVDKSKAKYEERFQQTYDISFSCQKPSTDTIAVDMSNNPLRDQEGNLIFRPAGHGALISNLGDIDADVVFIKNIDNVVAESYIGNTISYKKALGGILLTLQARVFDYMEDLEDGNLSDDQLDEIKRFCEEELSIYITPGFEAFETMEKIDYLYTTLDCPIRVCGMVKNEGEPGGGPFWVEHNDGNLSLQVVEQSQVDKNDQEQKEIAESATHFNPVDLVCGLNDFAGEAYDLLDFVDEDTAFISEKSYEGAKLKAMERPGLWNGAMANWITLFVEVPSTTFNPVKTFYDLLRDSHKSK